MQIGELRLKTSIIGTDGGVADSPFAKLPWRWVVPWFIPKW